MRAAGHPQRPHGGGVMVVEGDDRGRRHPRRARRGRARGVLRGALPRTPPPADDRASSGTPPGARHCLAVRRLTIYEEVQQVTQSIDPGNDDGRLVSGSALQELLETPNKVFGRPEDFKRANLIPTGYHVRLSAAPLVIPTGGKEKSFEYDEENPFPGHEFVVRPGEAAIISTGAEFVDLDLDVVADPHAVRAGPPRDCCCSTAGRPTRATAVHTPATSGSPRTTHRASTSWWPTSGRCRSPCASTTRSDSSSSSVSRATRDRTRSRPTAGSTCRTSCARRVGG